jgi:glutathione S-transferase
MAFRYIKGRLQGVYAVSDRLTAVDASLYPLYRWAKQDGIDVNAYTVLVNTLEKRESVQTVLAKARLKSVSGL